MLQLTITYERYERKLLMSDDYDVTVLSDSGNEVFYKPSNEEKLLAMLIYLLNFLTAIVGPLIIWLIKREESAYVDFHGKEYFNLLISFFIYEIVAVITLFIGIGFILIPVLSIGFLILIVIGAVKAYQGEYYRFPLIFRLIK